MCDICVYACVFVSLYAWEQGEAIDNKTLKTIYI